MIYLNNLLKLQNLKIIYIFIYFYYSDILKFMKNSDRLNRVYSYEKDLFFSKSQASL